MREAPAAERARLFVALELPGVVRDALVRWRAPVFDAVRGLRAVEPDYLHVTLCFLGWREAAAAPAIGAACRKATESCAEAALTLAEALWLAPRRPRVLAVAVADRTGALAAAQRALSEALADGGWYKPEPRPFLAHVTVARVGKDARVRPVELPVPPATPFVGSTVVVYRSRLGAAGARYEPLATVGLGASS